MDPPPSALVPRLLKWYRHQARDLPWRRTKDPYAIWISEIMLQQTQVKTVIPYWERWIEALPTLAALANARIDRVLKLWEGLGYYSRARNAQRAARLMVKEHGGRFPSSFESVLALPGIGRYTAGAICSIAFDQPAPILDGNVIRVLTRVFKIGGDPKEKQTNARLWSLAASLVAEADRSRVNGEPACSDLNQGLMELGATVCTPASPNCSGCPIKTRCLAFKNGLVDQLPYKPKRQPMVSRRFQAFVIEKQGRYFVRQRAKEEVNGGLWEFPNQEQNEPSASLQESPLCTIRHTIMRNRIQLDVFRVTSSDAIGSAGRWCTLKQLGALPFSSAHKQIVERLRRL